MSWFLYAAASSKFLIDTACRGYSGYSGFCKPWRDAFMTGWRTPGLAKATGQ